jgi:hypothetical protein
VQGIPDANQREQVTYMHRGTEWINGSPALVMCRSLYGNAGQTQGYLLQLSDGLFIGFCFCTENYFLDEIANHGVKV